MAVTETAPNETVRRVYDELGDLLKRGDDAFIEEGPAILQAGIEEPEFFDGVETEPAVDGYTRKKVIGDPGEHVIRFMEWPPEFPLLPHEHHGRPCFEVLVEGELYLARMEAEHVEDDRYTLDVVENEICRPGDAGVIDPRDGSDIHAVYSPVRSRSLHVYPEDNYYSVGYVREEGDGTPPDVYERERFELREES